MKKTLLLFLCMMFTMAAKSQMINIVDMSDPSRGDSIDKDEYEVVYDLSVMIPAKDTVRYSERMLLQVGTVKSAFFSYAAYQTDSLVQAKLAHGEKVNINFTAKVSWKLYKNFPSQGQTAYLDRVASDNFRVVENIENPQWQLVADSAKEILGYRCRLAVAKYKGRNWSAWYAEDVPIDNGPWKLQSLPGLILMAYDSNREFVFTAVGLTNVHGSRNIYYKGKSYTNITRKDLNKIYKHFYNDAIGYALMTFPQSSTNKLSIKDENGNDLKHSKPLAYNLIEW